MPASRLESTFRFIITPANDWNSQYPPFSSPIGVIFFTSFRSKIPCVKTTGLTALPVLVLVSVSICKSVFLVINKTAPPAVKRVIMMMRIIFFISLLFLMRNQKHYLFLSFSSSNE